MGRVGNQATYRPLSGPWLGSGPSLSIPDAHHPASKMRENILWAHPAGSEVMGRRHSPCQAVITCTAHSKCFCGQRGLCSQVPCLHGVLVVKDLRALKLILNITYSGILFTTHFKAERGTKQAQSGIPITLQVSASETTNTTSNPDHTKGLWGHKWFHLCLGQHSDVTSETKGAAACSTLRSVQHMHRTLGRRTVPWGPLRVFSFPCSLTLGKCVAYQLDSCCP